MTPRIFSILLVVFTIFTQFNNCAQVGDRCSFKHTSTSGICQIAADCPKVREQAQNGISPVICGFKDTTIPIVCCEGTANYAVPNENSFLDTDSNSAPETTFSFPEDNQPTRRISEQKCDEYSKLTTQSVNALALVSNAKPVTINITKCDYDGVPLIYGGQPAALGEFPFMAAIGFRDNDGIRWLCGGTLISDNYVLTAGHCTSTQAFGSPVLVRLGDLNLNRTDDGSNPIDISIEKIEVAPNYSRSQKYNDIALLKLSRSVSFDKFVRPACLWSRYNINQSSAIATGWGKTESGSPSDVLQKVELKILDNLFCNRTYEISRSLPNGIISSMLCAGELKGGKDTCQGDSGGPLLISKPGNPCVHYTVGITSFGKHCATASIPAVYTRVSEYLPWIENIVW